MRDDNDRLCAGDLPADPFADTQKANEAAAPSTQPAKAASGSPTEPVSPARGKLLSLIEGAGVGVFLSRDGEAWATRTGFTWRVHSKDFRSWLVTECFKQHGAIASRQTVDDVLELMESRARVGNDIRPVFVRVGRDTDGVLWLDLGEQGSARAVRLAPDGWKIVKLPGVHFVRERGTEALPEPRQGGRIDALRHLLNLRGKRDWVFVVMWMMGATRPDIPQPILDLQGEHGSAKSTMERLLRRILDPATPELRSLPRDEESLMVAGRRRWVLAFDNLSGLTPAMSDALCRLSTGGGVGKRKLYTDADEALLTARRPVIVNGIDDLLSRNDFASRALVLDLPNIPENRRRTEREVLAEFDRIHPSVLGALCDCVCAALREESQTRARLGALPRMADLVVWASAAESVLGWRRGTVQRAMAELAEEVAASALERDEVAAGLVKLMAGRQEWRGTMTELKADLDRLQGGAFPASWPRNSASLANALKRAAPVLRRVGVVWAKGKSGGTRPLVIRAVPAVPTAPSATNGTDSAWDEWDERDGSPEVPPTEVCL